MCEGVHRLGVDLVGIQPPKWRASWDWLHSMKFPHYSFRIKYTSILYYGKLEPTLRIRKRWRRKSKHNKQESKIY